MPCDILSHFNIKRIQSLWYNILSIVCKLLDSGYRWFHLQCVIVDTKSIDSIGFKYWSVKFYHSKRISKNSWVAIENLLFYGNFQFYGWFTLCPYNRINLYPFYSKPMPQNRYNNLCCRIIISGVAIKWLFGKKDNDIALVVILLNLCRCKFITMLSFIQCFNTA